MANAEGIGTIYMDTTGTLVSIPVRVNKILFAGDAGQACTLTLKDGGSGGVIQMVLRNDNDQSLAFDFNPPIFFGTDLYGTIAGTGAEAIIFFDTGTTL